MPRVFKGTEVEHFDKEIHKDYFDRHTPHIICDVKAKRGEMFKVKVKMGEAYKHPDDADHFISFIQLWNRETLLAQTIYAAGTFGGQPNNAEVDFYVVPSVSMNLTAMSNCTKHGLWQSDPMEVKVTD